MSILAILSFTVDMVRLGDELASICPRPFLKINFAKIFPVLKEKNALLSG